MFVSPTTTIGIALLIATGLVCFGVIRLIRHFQEEFSENDGGRKTKYSLQTDHNVVNPK